ncbi:MAG: Sec-independent protein translocase subunit TatA [Pseudonocardia sp.]|nr:Sec-independent protein translocase subunit TatA [Pseudonocardia sp.]
MPNLGGWELVVLLGVLLLVFGAKKLPDMARSIGQSARVFKGEMKGLKDDGKVSDAPSTAELPVVAPPVTAAMPVVEPVPVHAKS